MGRKKSYLTSSDNFCGVGGQTDGLMRAAKRLNLQVEPLIGLNHWDKACESYAANWPMAKVVRTDISAADPRWFPSTDIHLSSPECTKHSKGGGRKAVKEQLYLFEKGILDPAAERSRATMWDVPRFAEYHDYRIVIVENVIEARTRWAPYKAWLQSMYSLGYVHKTVYANSKFFWPCPQSRDRMYVVFWKKGNNSPDLDFRPLAWCKNCEKNVEAIQTWKDNRVRYGIYGRNGQYVYCCPGCANVIEPYYYAAFNAIDWSDRGTRIGDRTKPLADDTITRINYGLDKYHNLPFYLQIENSSNLSLNIKSTLDVFPTQNTRQTLALTVPPFIIDTNYSSNSKVRSVLDSFNTSTSQLRTSVVQLPVPIVVNNKGQSMSRPAIDSFNSMTTKPSHGILTDDAFHSFISYYYGKAQASSFIEPVNTMATVSGAALISYQKPQIEDCYYRMLKLHEGKRVMAFDDETIIIGNSKDQFRQLGNAVTPPALDWINGQCLKTLI